jgi:glycosyltransferase involved in cell wall biosynthesis
VNVRPSHREHQEMQPWIEFCNPDTHGQRPLVSVVMITYNHERYLAEAIEGVLRQQTGFPIELIIGEDCSKDRTREIALEYQKRFPEVIRLITSERNVGMHENHRRVIMAARGKYIAFCEGDDVWINTIKLKRQIGILAGDPEISLVCSNYQVISESGALINPDMNRPATSSPYYVTFDQVMLSGVVLTVTVCARLDLVKRALIGSPLCRKDSYPFADSPLWVELTCSGKCCVLPEVYAAYRRSATSTTRGLSPTALYRFSLGVFQFHSDVLDLYQLPQGDAATQRLRVSTARALLRSSAVFGDLPTATKQFQRLKELGVKPTSKDRLLCSLAKLAQPGTLASPLYRMCVFVWRTAKIGMRVVRGDATQSPFATGPTSMEYTWSSLLNRSFPASDRAILPTGPRERA